MTKINPPITRLTQTNEPVLSENFFSKVFEYGFDAIVVTDNSNNIKAWNKTAEKMFGYASDEIIGKPVSEFLIIDDNLRNEFRTLVRESGQWKGEVDVINKNGEKLHTIISISTIKDKDGNITDLIGIIQNISEKVALQENLLETSGKLQLIAEEKASFITQILERIDDGFASFDKDLNITYANIFFEKLFNKPASELIGINIKKFSTYFKSVAIVEQAFLSQNSLEKEYFSEKYRKWFFIKLYPSPNGVSVFVKDITEKKIIEQKLIQSEKLYSSLFENANDLIGIINENGEVVRVNQSMETLFGYTKEEALKMNITDFLFPYDNSKYPFHPSQIHENENLIINARFRKKDGGKIYAELNASRLPDGNYMGIIRDMTERKKAEEEKISQLLHYKMLMHTSQDAIHILDNNGKLVEYNQAFIKHLGYSKEEITHLYVWDWDLLWNKEKLIRLLSKTNEEGIYFETLHKLKDGSFRNMNISFSRFYDRNETFYYASARDITERKRLETEREQFFKFFNISSDLMVIADSNGYFKKINPAGLVLLGYTEEELLAKPFIDFVHPGDRQHTLEEMANQIKTGSSMNFENRYLCKNGASKILSWRANYIAEEGITYATARDITAKKLAEEEMKKSNRIHEFIGKTNELVLLAKDEAEIYNEICTIAVETGNFVFAWIGLPDTNTKTIKPFAWSGHEDGFLKDLKVSTEDIPEGNCPTAKAYREAKYYHCNDIEHDPVMKYCKDNALQHGYYSSISFPLIVETKVVATLTMYAVKANFFTDDELQMLVNVVSNINYALNAIHNNRKRIEAEDKLNLFKEIADNSVAYISIANLNLEFIYINKAMRKGLSIPDDVDISQYKVFKLDSKKSKKNVPAIALSLEKKGFWNGENEMMSFNNTIIPVLQTIILIKDANGNPRFTSSIAIDISEQKEREAELQKLAGIIENTKAIVFIVDLKFRFLYMNASAREKFEIGEEEDILQLSGLDFIPDETKQRMSIEQQQLFLEGKWVGEKVFKSKTGKLFTSLEVAIIHKDDEGNPKYISFTLLDITERIIAEDALKLSESKLRAILDNSYDAIAIYENGILKMCNPAAAKLFGASSTEKLIGTSVLDYIDPSEHQRVGNIITLRREGKIAPSTYITLGLKKDGTIFNLEVVASEFIQDNQHQVIAVLRDISDRLKNEQEMNRLNTELRILANHLSTIREEERSDIAKEIHDELAQNLVAMNLNASRLKNKIHDDSVKEIIDEQIEISNSVLKTSKTLFNSLHPSILDELGLEAAIKWYAKTRFKSTDIKFEFRTNAHIGNDNIPKAVNLGFFRIYQETITNILRHAKATTISIELIKSRDNLLMQIKDNGSGFDVGKVDTFQHHGLLVIRERVLSMRGEFTIDSAVGKGTTLEIKVPI